jgi:hypothetical protein
VRPAGRALEAARCCQELAGGDSPLCFIVKRERTPPAGMFAWRRHQVGEIKRASFPGERADEHRRRTQSHLGTARAIRRTLLAGRPRVRLCVCVPSAWVRGNQSCHHYWSVGDAVSTSRPPSPPLGTLRASEWPARACWTSDYELVMEEREGDDAIRRRQQPIKRLARINVGDKTLAGTPSRAPDAIARVQLLSAATCCIITLSLI